VRGARTLPDRREREPGPVSHQTRGLTHRVSRERVGECRQLVQASSKSLGRMNRCEALGQTARPEYGPLKLMDPWDEAGINDLLASVEGDPGLASGGVPEVHAL